MADTFNLARFVDAQRPVFRQVMAELHAGRKATHWMWFVFPQLRGLGRSEMASYYGVSGPDEARAYLQHEVLGPRLEGCVAALLEHRDLSALQMLGSPDDMKLRSSLTLFSHVQPESGTFQAALDQFFASQPDNKTHRLLQL